MKFTPSKPRPYKRRGKIQKGRWEVDLRGVLDNGLVVERERRVFPATDNAGPIGMRQAAAMALEEFERWNRHGQVLRPGETPALPRTGAMTAGAVPTFAQFEADYLDYCSSPNACRNGANAPATLDNKKEVLRLHLLPLFGTLRLDQLQRRDVDQYIVSKAKSGRSLSCIRKDVCILRQMISLAHDHQLVAAVPKFKLPPKIEREIVSLTPDDAERFLAVAQQKWIRDAVLMEFYLRTGLRLGEAVALRPCDFDLDAEEPTVYVNRTFSKGRFGRTKNRKSRLVPLAPGLPEKIEALLRARGLSSRSDADYPFSSRRSTKRPLSDAHVQDTVRALGEEAEIETVHPHMLRHTFGTDCARRGVPLLTIKEWMGHADVKVTMRYLHLSAPDHLRWRKLLA